jgi:hypothetical protein
MEDCYACKEKATSIEHVPPKCLFPELKDFPHKDLRKNLITVPSCETHNSAKSKDDEFLMISLAGMLGNNSIGYNHSITKVDRALRRSSHKLLERVFTANRRHHLIDLGDNKFIQAISGTPDLERLNNCVEQIAKGIYRHHFKENFNGNVKTLLSFLIVKDKNRSNLQKYLLAHARRDANEQMKHGANPNVFFYQIVEPDEFGVRLMKFSFYENVEIFCSLVPEGKELPANLGFDLMKRGIPVVFTLDGQEYPVHLE